MDLKKALVFKVSNASCYFRSLNQMDVSQSYLNGLREQNNYIENIPRDINLSSQRRYIRRVLKTEDETICGLFVDGVLLGTAGIQLSFSALFQESIDIKVEELATIGIFLFDKQHRGKGLGKTLVWAATLLFHECSKTKWFGAGMEKTNAPSYNAFLSCGYKKVFSDEKYNKVLINISELIKPGLIQEERIEYIYDHQ